MIFRAVARKAEDGMNRAVLPHQKAKTTDVPPTKYVIIIIIHQDVFQRVK